MAIYDLISYLRYIGVSISQVPNLYLSLLDNGIAIDDKCTQDRY